MELGSPGDGLGLRILSLRLGIDRIFLSGFLSIHQGFCSQAGKAFYSHFIPPSLGARSGTKDLRLSVVPMARFKNPSFISKYVLRERNQKIEKRN
jgi:hypothetical protein